MTDFGEAIGFAAGTIPGKWDCPFSHDDKKKKRLANQLKGVGTTLGTKLENGTQTIRNPDLDGNKKLDKVWRPAKDPDHDLCGVKKPISLVKLDAQTKKPGESKSYGLTCAAHHLIPAQASLKGCDLVAWMDTKAKGSKVNANVGYDVNGSQNGVWLPGNYAMRGKWSKLKNEEEDDVPDQWDGPVSGKIEVTQFYYAICAMEKVGAQFHDAHPDYSDFVQKRLNALAVLVGKTGGFCEQCPKKTPSEKRPPPYKLVLRLNQISRAMKNDLVGKQGGWPKDENRHTSKWVRAYQIAMKNKKKKFKVHSLA